MSENPLAKVAKTAGVTASEGKDGKKAVKALETQVGRARLSGAGLTVAGGRV